MAVKLEKIKAPASAPADDDGPLVTLPEFAKAVFGKDEETNKQTIRKLRRLMAAGVLPFVKLGRTPKPGKRDKRRIHIPLNSGRARLESAGGAP